MKRLALVIFLFPGISVAAITGNDLIQLCAPAAGKSANGACALYTRGFIDGNMSVDAKVLARAVVSSVETGVKIDATKNLTLWLCVPPAVTETQLKDLMFKFLTEHPEIRHQYAAILVDKALTAAFPCPAR